MAITKIATIIVPSGGQTTLDFQSIPQTFTDLMVVASIRNSSTYEHVLIGLNGSTSNFSGRYLTAYGSSGQTGSSTYARYLGNTSRAGYTANTFGSTSIYIPNYTSSNYKSISAESISENNDTANWANVITANLWSQTAAITSLQLTNESAATILEFSSATLYGITKGSGGATVA
jgi:hypothetical protein